MSKSSNQNKYQSKITILIDESGTLPDPKDKIIIVAAVGTGSALFMGAYRQK